MKKLVSLAFVCVLFETTGYSADFFCGAGNVDCLISAIGVANTNGEDNSIFLEEGTYTLTAVDNVSDGPSGLPVVTGRLRIVGPYNIGSTIERDPAWPVFRLLAVGPGGDLVLDWIGNRGGSIQRSGNQSGFPCGGAIHNRGSLSINRTAIYNNLAMLTSGGAICNNGNLFITHSEIRQNSAGFGGRIYSSTSFDVEDVLFDKNDAPSGGSILSSGSGVVLDRLSHTEVE